MSAESGPELLPINALRLLMSIHICIPPFRCGSFQLVQSNQHSLPVSTLHNLELFLNHLQPVIGIHGLHWMWECGWLSPLKHAQFVSWLRLWHRLVSLGILHGHYGLLDSLKHLCLHDQHLLQRGWWWWVALVVVVGVTILGVHHLKHGGVHKTLR
jgi:hypothetical protein